MAIASNMSVFSMQKKNIFSYAYDVHVGGSLKKTDKPAPEIYFHAIEWGA
ncbi:MAG: hypothetical protein JEZ12_15170 [Desulfobacterium sp.]|nr:hypothetical protein [Desulfobacterium sp.]